MYRKYQPSKKRGEVDKLLLTNQFNNFICSLRMLTIAWPLYLSYKLVSWLMLIKQNSLMYIHSHLYKHHTCLPRRRYVSAQSYPTAMVQFHFPMSARLFAMGIGCALHTNKYRIKTRTPPSMSGCVSVHVPSRSLYYINHAEKNERRLAVD